MNPISKTSFTLKPLSQEAYELEIQFSNTINALSKKTFTFIEEPKPKKGRTVDILTKNGETTVENLFCKKDLVEAKKNAKLLSHKKISHDQAVAVLDLKDPQKRYLPTSDVIQLSEKSVVNFFHTKSETKKTSSEGLRDFFQKTLPLDFLICEGSLKRDLLTKGGFSEQEIEYLNGPDGATTLCQCAEFFMNAFKLGQIAKGPTSEFHADSYLKSISQKSEKWTPTHESTVFYPHLYKKIYSLNGTFAETLKSVFSLSGEYDKSSKVTLWNVAKKI